MSETQQQTPGHVEVFYRDQTNTFRRTLARCYIPTATLQQDLESGAWLQRIRQYLVREGLHEIWIGPWRYGSRSKSQNPIQTECFYEMDVRYRSGPKAGVSETLVITDKLTDIEQFMWNREENEARLRGIFADRFEILSINAISVGRYVSYLQPIDAMGSFTARASGPRPGVSSSKAIDPNVYPGGLSDVERE
jgi:hypothetical protein